MSGKLTSNSTPAERAVGCSFAENFVSQADVELNGGTVAGTPTIDFGATFDGTTDYISYVLDGKEFNSDELSIVIEFNPDFEADDDEDHCLMGGGSSDDYWLLKHNANSIRLDLGNTTIGYIPLLDYQSYWNVGSRNVIVVSGTSGNTSVWLNGNVILDEKNTVWTETIIDNMTIGSRHSSKSSFFVGTISNFQVYKSLLTAQDALNFYNNDTYNYRNKAVLDLPMGMAQHDPTNVRCLDVSGNGKHAQFGDGSTSTTYPTKQTTHGYDFDGGDYMIATPDLNVGDSGSLAFVMEFSPDFNYDENAVTYLYGSTAESIFAVIKQNNASSNVLDIWMGNEKIDSIAEATYSPYWRKGQRNELIISGTGGDGSSNITRAWLNGVEIMNDTVEWYGGTDVTSLTMGASYSIGNFFNGKITSFQVYPFILTPTQVQDLTINLMKKINDV